MTLTKYHNYLDRDVDTIEAQSPGEAEERGVTALLYLRSAGGVFVESKFAVPLALNVLGHDRPDDDPLAAKFSVEDAVVSIAQSPSARDFQLHHAAALLMAVDGYDRRTVRLATAEERRNAAAKRLGDTVSAIRRANNELTGDDIGKLREALGRYDAELSK